MKPLGFTPIAARTCGFRFSIADGAVIALCAIATTVALPLMGQLALLAPIVLGHFFLFCNVFRVRPSSELTWAGLFVANSIVHLFLSSDGSISALALIATQFPVTVFLIWKELRSERYHGIGCRALNSKLSGYLDGSIP